MSQSILSLLRHHVSIVRKYASSNTANAGRLNKLLEFERAQKEEKLCTNLSLIQKLPSNNILYSKSGFLNLYHYLRHKCDKPLYLESPLTKCRKITFILVAIIEYDILGEYLQRSVIIDKRVQITFPEYTIFGSITSINDWKTERNSFVVSEQDINSLPENADKSEQDINSLPENANKSEQEVANSPLEDTSAPFLMDDPFGEFFSVDDLIDYQSDSPLY